MKKAQQGFSVVEVLIIVVVLLVVGGVGYFAVSKITKSTKKTDTTTSTQSKSGSSSATPAAGTSASIDLLTAQDASSEAAIDSKYAQGEQTTAASTNTAVSNVGGSIDETSL